MGDGPHRVSITLHENPDSKEAIEFYRRLGMCIGSWAFVDRRPYQIFHHATGFEQKQSALLYYRNRAFNQRLRMVDDAVKIQLSKEELANEWRPLHDEAVNLSHTRNIFAHHPTLRPSLVNIGRLGTNQTFDRLDNLARENAHGFHPLVVTVEYVVAISWNHSSEFECCILRLHGASKPIERQHRHHHHDCGGNPEKTLGTDLDTPNIDVEFRWFGHDTALH